MSMVNRYTWGTIGVPILPDMTHANKYDVVVCVSVWDAQSTMDIWHRNVVWWLRGWEDWVYGEKILIDKLRQFSLYGKIITNATHLIDKCNDIGVDAECCFAGLDLDFWKKLTQVPKMPMYSGVLDHRKHKFKDNGIIDKLIYCDQNLAHVFSDSNYNKIKMREVYNACSCWLSLSTNEGFHQMPAEAALCGCPIIYNDVPHGGTSDYCTPDTATPFKTFDELLVAIDTIDYSKVNAMRNMLHAIGARESNMLRFVEMIS